MTRRNPVLPALLSCLLAVAGSATDAAELNGREVWPVPSVLGMLHFRSTAPVLISEVVTDPQQDWEDSDGGNGVPFDDVPGTGSVSSTDEWIELVNASLVEVDLTGWTLEMFDSTPTTLTLSTPGTTVLAFSAGSSLGALQPGGRLVIGNPPGNVTNDCYLVLRDATSAVVDDVEIGDDFEGDGAGDGAPAPGENGNATGPTDEAIARYPDGTDSDNDVADFDKRAATIGAENGAAVGVILGPRPVVGPLSFEVHPRPLRHSSVLTFHTDESCDVEITLLDPGGREVAREAGIHLEPGMQRHTMATPPRSGVYWVQVRGRTSGGLRVEAAQRIVVIR